jgi:hypothetical protein
MPALIPRRENGAGELLFALGALETLAAEPEPGAASEFEEEELDEEGSVAGLARANGAGETAARARITQRVLLIGRSPE